MIDNVEETIKRLKALEERIRHLEALEYPLITRTLVDYGPYSTITGWSSLTQRVIQYMRIGKLVIVNFRLDGASDGASATFTLPHNSAINTVTSIGTTINNDEILATPGRVSAANGSNVITVQRTTAGASFTASGRKGVYGQFWYVTA